MRIAKRLALVGVISSLLLLAGTALARAQDCGPFTDLLLSDPFCPAALEVHNLGLTAGTSATTFGPTEPVTRQALAAILTRGHRPGAAVRQNRRAALDQFWTTQGPPYEFGYGTTAIGVFPTSVVADGRDIWVASPSPGSVKRIRASDGRVLSSIGIGGARILLAAMNLIFITDLDGGFFVIHPAIPNAFGQAAIIGTGTLAMASDGSRIWTANLGSVSMVHPGSWTVDSAGGFGQLTGMVYDGHNIWVSDFDNDALLKLDQDGGVVQTVAVGSGPWTLLFDGTNIWVPLASGPVTIVRAATGAVVATLTGNGLSGGFPSAAFDGERVLVTNYDGSSVSLFRAADFAPLGSFPAIPGLGDYPDAVCSNGVDFFIAMHEGRLARF